MARSRRTVLGYLLAAVLVLAAASLRAVVETVVFAVTVAYVLYPLRRRLVERGFSQRVSSAAATSLGFVGLLVVVSPVVYVVYQRRASIVDLLMAIPPELTVVVAGAEFVVETAPVLAAVRTWLTDTAIGVAGGAPVLALKLALFVMVVYGILYKPGAAPEALQGLVPPPFHDVLRALHERVRTTLLGLYVLQAATSLGTVVTGFLVFLALGYEDPFTLAVISGVLQFVPIVGPSLVVLGLAAHDVVAGNDPRAVAVLVLGLFFVGFLPDAIIRPRLANVASHMPATLYFVGFVGGVLSLGAIGFVVGPLVVALLVEVVGLLSDGEPG